MTLIERLSTHAAERPEQVALAWPGGELRYAALPRQVAAAVRQLRELAADVVAVDLENGPAWIVLDIAAMQLDICLVPLPSFFSPRQLRHVIRQSAVQAVISDNPRRLRERLGEVLRDEVSWATFADQQLSWIASADAIRQQPRRMPPGVHKITFTSGTTGEPKGVMLSWAQIRPVVAALVAAPGMTAADHHLALMPLAVLLENIGGVYVSLWAGARASLLPMERLGLSGSSGLNGTVLAHALRDCAATTAILTPQLLQGLIEAMQRDVTLRPALRFAAVGGAPVSPRLLQCAAELGLPVFEGYGLSECASVVCLNTPAANRPGSVGRPLPHLRLRIADDGWRGELSLDSYRAFLGQAYHHVKHTTPLLMACGSRVPHDREWLRDAMAEYVEEEVGHQEWILDDIRACGVDPQQVRHAVPGAATELMVAYAYHTVDRGNPVGFLGMVLVLEGTSVHVASEAAVRL